MIVDSVYWRRDLYRYSRDLRKKATQRRWPESAVALLEKQILLGCFSVRKLMESGKLPDFFGDLPIDTVGLPRKRPVQPSASMIYPFDIFDVRKWYSLADAKESRTAAHILINQIIHSRLLVYIVSTEWDQGEAVVLVSSDRGVKTQVIGLWLRDLALLFEWAAVTEATTLFAEWNTKLSDYKRTAAGQVAEDLEEWGFATEVEAAATLKRLRGPSECQRLDLALQDLEREITEYEAQLDAER